MIQGVIVKPLKIISDERGKVMHMLKRNNELLREFGEVYFSTVNPGVVKGWKKHVKAVQNFAVPIGNIKVVLYDDREDSETKGVVQEILIGEDSYCLLHIPSGVWYSFGAEKDKFALITNCTDLPHDPQETESESDRLQGDHFWGTGRRIPETLHRYSYHLRDSGDRYQGKQR